MTPTMQDDIAVINGEILVQFLGSVHKHGRLAFFSYQFSVLFIRF